MSVGTNTLAVHVEDRKVDIFTFSGSGTPAKETIDIGGSDVIVGVQVGEPGSVYISVAQGISYGSVRAISWTYDSDTAFIYRYALDGGSSYQRTDTLTPTGLMYDSYADSDTIYFAGEDGQYCKITDGSSTPSIDCGSVGLSVPISSVSGSKVGTELTLYFTYKLESAGLVTEVYFLMLSSF